MSEVHDTSVEDVSSALPYLVRCGCWCKSHQQEHLYDLPRIPLLHGEPGQTKAGNDPFFQVAVADHATDLAAGVTGKVNCRRIYVRQGGAEQAGFCSKADQLEQGRLHPIEALQPVETIRIILSLEMINGEADLAAGRDHGNEIYRAQQQGKG